jgi:mono/diheme cytochrome c family protein
VSVIDLSARKEVRRIAVQREPVAADITPDGKYLLVANHLPAGPADGDYAAAVVSVIDLRQTAYVANYFSDTLSVLDLSDPQRNLASIPLYLGSAGVPPAVFGLRRKTPPAKGANLLTGRLPPADQSAGRRLERPGRSRSPDRMSLARKGEFYFHDATICFQGWQSCSSCHPGDARADGFNWDLLNDGIGNPKNTKSLLLAFQTPPAMSLGVRETAGDAVRAGIEHILFTKQPEEVALAIDEYLKSLKPVPSPFLADGELSASARRGQRLFQQAGCADCHPSPLFTDLHPHEVGTRNTSDRPKDKFQTPTLVEIWRTAPYLHDGSAATIRDVLTTHNPHDQHGHTSSLGPQEITDLCAYVLSL